jgi:hypothetical protein
MQILPRSAFLLGLLVGCYSPLASVGSPCDTTEQCPSAQHCAEGHCVIVDPPEVDAPPAEDAALVATPDAAIDAPPLACSAAGLTCTGGTATTFTCGGNCWVRCTQHVTYDAAKTACLGWSGKLAQVDDATEQTCAAQHAPLDTWLGLVQAPAQTMPGMGWTWNGTTAPVYTRWGQGEPNDDDDRENGSEQCGKMQQNGTWDDSPCTQTIAFFCERPQ